MREGGGKKKNACTRIAKISPTYIVAKLSAVVIGSKNIVISQRVLGWKLSLSLPHGRRRRRSDDQLWLRGRYIFNILTESAENTFRLCESEIQIRRKHFFTTWAQNPNPPKTLLTMRIHNSNPPKTLFFSDCTNPKFKSNGLFSHLH